MAADLLTRRTALKYATLVTLGAQGWHGFPGYAAVSPLRGYGADPNLLKRPVTWPRTLTSSQVAMLASLCNIILPVDPPHPSAASIGVHEFLDEWVSAPYPQMQTDRTVIVNGLVALDNTTRDALGIPFAEAELSDQTAVFDRVCDAEVTTGFTRRLIELVCDGYYTTREGHAAIGYVGNVPLGSFPGPPPGVVVHLEKVLSELPIAPVGQ